MAADRVSPKPRSDRIYQLLCPQQEEVEQAVPSKLPSATQTSLGLCSGRSRGCTREQCLGAKCPFVFPLLPDDPMTMEQPQPNLPDPLVIVSDTEAGARPGKSLAKSADAEPVSLSPSLIPAPQPTISLLCEDSADTLSVESLTLVPPVDPHSLHTLAGIPPPPPPAAEGTGTLDEGAVPSEPAGPAEH